MSALAAIADAMMQAGHRNVRLHPRHEPSLWLHGRLVDLETRLTAGELRGCGHLVPGVPLTAPLWVPGTAWCHRCVEAGARVDEAEAFRCDRCGGTSGAVTTCTSPLSWCLVVFGLCADCRRKEVGR